MLAKRVQIGNLFRICIYLTRALSPTALWFANYTDSISALPPGNSTQILKRFLTDNADAIAAFKRRQQTAFDAERERWRIAGQAEYISEVVAGQNVAILSISDRFV